MSIRAIWKYNSIAGACVNSSTTTNANTFKYKWVSRPQYGSLELRLTNGRKHMWQVRQVDSAFRQIAKCDPDTVTKFSLKSRLQIHKTGLHYEHISIYLVPLTQSFCSLFLISDEHLDPWWANFDQFRPCYFEIPIYLFEFRVSTWTHDEQNPNREVVKFRPNLATTAPCAKTYLHRGAKIENICTWNPNW